MWPLLLGDVLLVVKMEWSEEDEGFIATTDSDERLRYCSAFGEDEEEAFLEFREAAALFAEELREAGEL